MLGKGLGTGFVGAEEVVEGGKDVKGWSGGRKEGFSFIGG